MKAIPLRDFQREGAKAFAAGSLSEPWLLSGREQEFILLAVAFHEPEPAPWALDGPDRDDLVFLARAKATSATLVTGNLAHFPEGIRAGVRVLTPAGYLAVLAT